MVTDAVKEKVCSFDALYDAMLKCRRNVMWKDSVSGYVKNGLANCHKLRERLLDGSYRIDKYSVFTIHEPKTRQIVSTRMKDRVFQRSLVDNYLYDAITKSFIYDNCACQIKRGTKFARGRLKCHMQRHFRKHGSEGYILSCDISNFFGSVPHEVAKRAALKNVDNAWAREHVERIIDSYSRKDNPGVGLGLGSQVTQLIMLAVLDDMDHMIKEELQIKHYVRYMDDFSLIHHDKKHLIYCLKRIEEHITGLGLTLNKNKTQIFPLRQGLSFLGFRFHLTNSGKIIMKLLSRNAKRVKRKLKKMKELFNRGKLTKSDIEISYTAWQSHSGQGNSYSLLSEMNKFYNSLWQQEVQYNVQVY